MTDIRQDLAKTAEKVATMAKEVAYVAIGVGILGSQPGPGPAPGARRCRRACSETSRGRSSRPATRWRSGVKDFDATVGQLIKTFDSTLDPVWQRLPEPAQASFSRRKRHATRSAPGSPTLPPDQAEPLAPVVEHVPERGCERDLGFQPVTAISLAASPTSTGTSTGRKRAGSSHERRPRRTAAPPSARPDEAMVTAWPEQTL